MIALGLPARIVGRALFVLAIWLAPVGLIDAVAAEPAAPDTLVGKLLVAAPGIGDPRFDGTVIFLIRHDKTGAMGIVINRPLGEETIADLLEALGADGHGVSGRIQLFSGGPVQPQFGFVLHSRDYHDAKTEAVDHDVAVTSDTEILRAIAQGKGPRQRLVAFGYAGWGAGQLERELERNDWYVVPADPGLLFEVDRDSVWQRAYERRRLPL